jgi:Glycosyl hydrolases family 2, TIM barrel domain
VRELRHLIACLFVTCMCLHGHATGTPERIEIRGKEIYVAGSSFVVKGVHYGPWRPGTGPSKRYAYPTASDIDSDLGMVSKLNANTILVVDAPGYVLDIAEKHGLKVLYCFYLNWYAFGSDQDLGNRANIRRRVEQLRDKPALFAWVLGNEIPAQVVEARGQRLFEGALADLYRSVKVLDGTHPITHSNWPMTKSLNLSFFDITSFNLYPLWPPEVVALGFDNYIREVLQPIAGNKPLLMTEFGANSLEATEQGQARLMGQCWRDLRSAGACGGLVFEFADEWWKNYDNPIREGDWWNRRPAPDDERTHDRDPEEYYGLYTGERTPKPAAGVVKEMFAAGSFTAKYQNLFIPAAAVALLLFAAVAATVRARIRQSTPVRRGK